jgi:AraC-like DNA-binding protein
MTREVAIERFRDRFDSYAEFNAKIREWGTDFRQIGRGRLTADLAQQTTGRISLLQLRFNRAVAMTGAPPPGTRTFGIVGLDSGVSWNGREVNPNQVLCFDADREFVSFAPSGFVARTISVEESLLESVAANLGYTDFRSDLLRHETIAPGRLRDLARLVAKINAPRQTARTLFGIVEDLVLILGEGHPDTTSVDQSRYTRIVDQAISFILENAWQAPTVGEVCAAVGVSMRTLDRAFHSRLGHGPKDCIQAARLNAVRQELLKAEPNTRIRDVALRWGFWHMGDFGKSYRKEFGELPSNTLARPGISP